MDARTIIADAACRPDWNRFDTADYIIRLLTEAGFTILHDSENHGPTRDRAATLIDDRAQDFNKIRDPGMANHCRSLAKRVRAMEGKP